MRRKSKMVKRRAITSAPTECRNYLEKEFFDAAKNNKGRGRWGCEYSPGSSSPQKTGESSLLQSTTTRIIREVGLHGEGFIHCVRT